MTTDMESLILKTAAQSHTIRHIIKQFKCGETPYEWLACKPYEEVSLLLELGLVEDKGILWRLTPRGKLLFSLIQDVDCKCPY